MSPVLFLRADFERITLNAMEERVLPPEIRIKIVFAQAQAVAQEEEDVLDANVSDLRTKSHKICYFAGQKTHTRRFSHIVSS